MNLSVFMPVNLLSGKNIICNSIEVFKNMGKKVLIITGKSSAKQSGALDDIINIINELRINYTIFNDVTQNPYVSTCKAAGDIANKTKCDSIIGIGGGSVLDSAKAAALFATNPNISSTELFDHKYKNKPLPFILVGTTAGTGSEITKISVLTIDQTGHKKALAHNDLYAKAAFADPRYTYTMPKDITITTALDAFAHAVEGFFSPGCSDFPTVCAKTAIPILWESLNWLYNNLDNDFLPSSDIRDKLYFGSLWAGLVLNSCGTAYPHPFGYILTEDFGIPHGKACTAFLPLLVLRGEEFANKKYQKFLSLINTDFKQFKHIIDSLTNVQITITSSMLENYLYRFTNLKNFAATPGGFDLNLSREVFMQRFNIVD